MVTAPLSDQSQRLRNGGAKTEAIYFTWVAASLQRCNTGPTPANLLAANPMASAATTSLPSLAVASPVAAPEDRC